MAVNGNFAAAANYFEQLSQSAVNAAQTAAQAALQAGNAAAAAYFAGVDRAAAEADYNSQAAAALDSFGAAQSGAESSAQAAGSAAQAAAASWRSAASSIQQSLERMRANTSASTAPAARYAETKAVLDAYTQAALGGDVDAAGKLSGAAEAFLSASQANSVSYADYMRDRVLTEGKLASVLDTSEAQASVQDSIASAANAAVGELKSLNSNLTGFSADLYRLLQSSYQGADRETAGGVAASLAKMQADWDAYFADSTGFGAVGNKYTDPSFNGASFTKLDNNMAAFTGADGVVAYLRESESLLDVAKRVPELRALWEQQYGIKLPAFADGGMHAGGLRLVGERGWEIEATGPARYWNQAQLSQALAGGQGSSNGAEVAAAIRDLSAQLVRLEQSQSA